MSEHEHEHEHEHEQQSEPASEENEETIQDLDVAKSDAEDVKGGLGGRYSPDK